MAPHNPASLTVNEVPYWSEKVLVNCIQSMQKHCDCCHYSQPPALWLKHSFPPTPLGKLKNLLPAAVLPVSVRQSLTAVKCWIGSTKSNPSSFPVSQHGFFRGHETSKFPPEIPSSWLQAIQVYCCICLFKVHASPSQTTSYMKIKTCLPQNRWLKLLSLFHKGSFSTTPTHLSTHQKQTHSRLFYPEPQTH